MKVKAPRPGTVLGTIAILAVCSSGAYAAGSAITSKQIKDGTIKLKDLSKSAQTSLKGNVGPAGAAGATGAGGAAGASGAKGDRGFSAWDTIPSGVTVTGMYAFDAEKPASGGDFKFSIALPGRAPNALQDADVSFGSTGIANDDSPACSGTFQAPTAPAGKVCIYTRLDEGISEIAGTTLGTGEEDGQHTGFYLSMSGTAGAGDIYINGTWAYKAP